ncbi:MAG: hypothetical protein ACP5QN_00335, partial [Minisyncoccia bacterium]
KLGNDLAQELSSKIFEPVKSLLEKNYSPPKEEQEPDLFDAIIEELKKLNAAGQNKNLKNLEKISEEKISDQKIIPETVFLRSDQKISPEPVFLKKEFTVQEPISSKPRQSFVINEIKIKEQPKSTFTIPNLNVQEEQKAEIKNINSIQKTTTPTPSISPFPNPIPKSPTPTPTPPNPSSIPIPKPVFIHKEEKLSSIKSEIENKIPEIKISEIKTPPPPPAKKAEIEIGIKKESESLNSSNIKVVNYSDPKLINNTKNDVSALKPQTSNPPTQIPSSSKAATPNPSGHVPPPPKPPIPPPPSKF